MRVQGLAVRTQKLETVAVDLVAFAAIEIQDLHRHSRRIYDGLDQSVHAKVFDFHLIRLN